MLHLRHRGQLIVARLLAEVMGHGIRRVVTAPLLRVSWRIDSSEACANRGVASNFAVAL
jgi:hypothetical protein